MMDYGEILTRAWKITWKFKVLWIFGILASCGTRSGGNVNFNNTFNSGGNGFSNSTPNLPPAVMDALNRFALLFQDPSFIWKFGLTVITVVCVLVVLQIFLNIMGQVGLIKGVMEAEGGAEHLAFGELWGAGLHYFWRMFGLILLVGSPFFILILLFGVIGVLAALGSQFGHNSGSAAGLLVILPVVCVLACVLVLLALIVGFISEMAQNAIVVENQGVISGLKRGWEVLTKNLGPILIIWLIIAAIGIVAGIVIVLPLLIVLAPLVIAFIANINNANFSSTPWIITFVGVICIYIPISLVANGILLTYSQSVWTLTYLRLTKPKEQTPAPPSLPVNA
jgi:hypothetical protein